MTDIRTRIHVAIFGQMGPDDATRAVVRDVLETMREPTEAMNTEGCIQHDGCETSGCLGGETIDHIRNAMIGAALAGAGALPDDFDVELITGSLFTQWTCERCGCVNDKEGDATGEVLQCDECDLSHHITEVR